MTTENIKSANDVIADFLDAQAEKTEMDKGTITAVRDLKSQGNLTKTKLLRQLEEVREAAIKASQSTTELTAADD